MTGRRSPRAWARTWDDRTAVEVLERIHKFGDCRVKHAERPDELRRAIRAEARRRRQQIRTFVVGSDVYVWTTEPSIDALAYKAARPPLTVALPGDEPSTPLVSHSERDIDAHDPWH